MGASRQGRVVQEVRQLRPEDTGCRVGERRQARVWVGRGTSIQNERAGAAEKVWWLGGRGRKMNHFWTFWSEDTQVDVAR